MFSLYSVLMLNAAVGSPGGGTFDNNLAAWKSMMDINLYVDASRLSYSCLPG